MRVYRGHKAGINTVVVLFNSRSNLGGMDILGGIIQNLQLQASQFLAQFRNSRGNISIQIELNPMNRRAVDIVSDIINNPSFEAERMRFPNPNNVDIIVDSFGGDADSAYHIAKILNTHFSGTITYIVPRYAKSAATLLVCGGNKIVLGETSELGPLDPQIYQNDGSYISAKAVKSTLDLIKKQLKTREKSGLELAAILASRLNPLVLGQYDSSLDIAKKYQKELLLLRMFKSPVKVNKIVNKFAEGFTHHSRVIGCEEAKKIFGDNLEVWESNKEEWKCLWRFYETNRNIKDLIGVIKLIDKHNNQ